MSFWILPKDSDLIVNPCCLYLFATRFEINQYFFSDVIAICYIENYKVNYVEDR